MESLAGYALVDVVSSSGQWRAVGNSYLERFYSIPSLLCDVSHMLQTSSGSAFVMDSNASQQLSLSYTFFFNWRTTALQYCAGSCHLSA